MEKLSQIIQDELEAFTMRIGKSPSVSFGAVFLIL